jgi:hypothetical protein
MAKRGKYNKDDPEAKAARDRVVTIIDSVPPEDLVMSIKRAPSLRGMILGYIAEEMFEKYVPAKYGFIASEDIEKHDDHDRQFNKSDRTIKNGGRLYRIQLKSVQTNSIKRNLETGLLQADVQNDASDSRTIHLPSGNSIITTCYARGDYDILAVPLFPFTGEWIYAYKRNIDCRSSTSEKYTAEDAKYLLATTEIITWPLTDAWTVNLGDLLTDDIGLVATKKTIDEIADGDILDDAIGLVAKPVGKV